LKSRSLGGERNAYERPTRGRWRAGGSRRSGWLSSGRGPSKAFGHYEVGYKKPPRHTQFKKGQIANPWGRPKGAKSLSTLVDEALSAQIDLTIGRRKIRTSKRDAMVKQYVDKALRGDMKAFAMLVKLDPKARLEEQGAAGPDALAHPDDLAGVSGFLHRDSKPEDDEQ
jgi:hypothetical protein